MIRFILNDKQVSTQLPAGSLLIDFIRYEQNLKGTKIGCREGDCGACVVLVGEWKDGELEYQSLTSCLTPLANIHLKHVVTIEGVNIQTLNPIQQAMADESATQCGFCTPGFVMSFAGFSLSKKEPTCENAIAAVDGNICRCTGYKSIERAAKKIASILLNKGDQDSTAFLASNHFFPAYFTSIKERLRSLVFETNGEYEPGTAGRFVGGGTDLYVQQHDALRESTNRYLLPEDQLKGIYKEGNTCVIGASTTVTELSESPLMLQLFPKLKEHIKLVSSTPIRNIATIAGNIINASPIGDLTIFFLVLNTTIVLTNGTNRRELPLRKLYKGYKSLDKHTGEYIEKIWFQLPAENTFFHFEKVSKRTWLDIATVNTAISITISGNEIAEAHLSAGGVGPIPMFLEKTSNFLTGKLLNEKNVLEAIAIAQTEITPIDDVRGTAAYKRLLLAQLIKAHFVTLFPDLEVGKLFHV